MCVNGMCMVARPCVDGAVDIRVDISTPSIRERWELSIC